MLGKTVTAELAVHQPGATCNSLDLARSCGASFSGSVAAVAIGTVPILRGLPVGAQIVSHRFNDYLLLEYGEYLRNLDIGTR